MSRYIMLCQVMLVMLSQVSSGYVSLGQVSPGYVSLGRLMQVTKALTC